jgi:KUP system potassium uptake protein
VLFLVMYIWRRGTAIERTQSVYLPVREYLDQLFDLSHDESYPLLADNLVFLTNDSSLDKLDRDILYSILDKRPKRARAYYFLNVQVTDEPYTHEYMVNTFDTDFVFKVQLRLGFRVNQRVNTYLYQIVEDLVEHNQLAPQNHKYSIYRKHSIVGDFRFCLIRKILSPETDISGADSRTIEAKYFIRRLCGTPMRWYGLENSSVIFEYVPLFAKAKRQHKLTRIPIDANAVLAAAPKKVVAKPAEGDEDSDDEDIFSASMHNEREENANDAEKTLVGGDTASFKPLRIDEEDEDDEDSEEEELEYAVKAAETKIGEEDQGDDR